MSGKETPSGAGNVHAGFRTAEAADVSSGDFSVTINNKEAMGIYVGNTGNIKLTTPNGEDVTYLSVAGGQIHALPCTKIFDAGTTVPNKATDLIVGAW